QHLLSPELISAIDQQTLYTLCPFVSELKNVISDYLNFISKSSTASSPEVRKIVPVTASNNTTKSVNFGDQSASGLDSKLEEAFYFVHSCSLKKIVEFVGERVASNVIRTIKSNVVNDLQRELDQR